SEESSGSATVHERAIKIAELAQQSSPLLKSVRALGR
ncbi:MAG: hypothetical protein JWN66_4398, partial [Sphingomonas bacterium]|nr:hypothetical protein [Sphingomonas bacterium]